MAKTKGQKKQDLTIEHFLRLSDLGVKEPKLILGIIHTDSQFYGQTYKFKPTRTWVNVVHETRGPNRKQRYITGTFLQPESVLIENGIRKLDERWHGSSGEGETKLSLLNSYEADLKRFFNVSCNTSWKSFEEGFYPIDLEYLNTLSNIEHSYRNLDEFIEWKSGFERAVNNEKRWNLFILGRNKT